MSLDDSTIACIGSCADVSLWEVDVGEEADSWSVGRWGGSVLGNDAVIVSGVLADMGMHPICYLLNPTKADTRCVREKLGSERVVAVSEVPGDLTRSLCIEDSRERRRWVFARVPKCPAVPAIRDEFIYSDYYPELADALNSQLCEAARACKHLILNISVLAKIREPVRLPFRPTVLQASVLADVTQAEAMACAMRLVESTMAGKVFVTMGSRGAVLATSIGCWHFAPERALGRSILGAGAIFSSQVIRGLVSEIDGESLLRHSVDWTAQYLGKEVGR